MIVKLAGALLIVLSSAGLGYYLSVRDYFRISDLDELKKSLLLLRSEIEYMNNTLPAALNRLAETSSPGLALFFRNVAEDCGKKNSNGFEKIWSDACAGLGKHMHLDKEDIAQLEALGKTLGCQDKKLHRGNIENLIESIDITARRLAAAAEANRKMYRSLGLLTGLLISIMIV